MSYTKKHREEIIKVLNLSEGQRDPFRRLVILFQQLGELADGIEYSTAFPEDKKAYETYTKTGLGDALIQLLFFKEMYGWDLQELLDVGIERLKEFRLRGNFKE